MTAITPPVEKAIEEIQSSFPECIVDVDPDGAGGAYIVVRGVALGAPYSQPDTWIGFQITYQYPYADVYPHFTRSDLTRVDCRSLGEGFGVAQWRNKPAIQISRKSNK